MISDCCPQSAIRNPQSAMGGVDLLLISGGASVGEHDFTRGLLEELGYAIHVSRTTTRPGKPMIFGSQGNRVAFGLPGNPLAHFVCLNLYVRQALWRFRGRPTRLTFARACWRRTSPQVRTNARHSGRQIANWWLVQCN